MAKTVFGDRPIILKKSTTGNLPESVVKANLKNHIGGQS
jgi:hypothetical protein